MRLAAGVLGAGNRLDSLAHAAGLAYGLAGLLRNRAAGGRRVFLDGADVPRALADAGAHLAQARRMERPRGALPAFLPATLVPLYLRHPARDVTIHRRQIALLGAALRGRI
jgi:hypothetical protein